MLPGHEAVDVGVSLFINGLWLGCQMKILYLAGTICVKHFNFSIENKARTTEMQFVFNFHKNKAL